MKKCFVFCHGFGLDASYWERIRPYFAHEQCLYLDLGYFGSKSFSIPSGAELIGIGHSLGFMKLLMTGREYTKLIGLQSFTHFLGCSHQLQAKRRTQLAQFTKDLHKDPTRTLQSLYRRSGLSFDNKKFLSLDSGRLFADVDYLLRRPSDFCTQHESAVYELPMLIIGSKDDVVVPLEVIYDNFAHVDKATIAILENGRHCLGYMAPQIVYQMIMDFVYG